MAQLTYPITSIEGNKASVTLAKSLYSAEAIHASAYKFSGEYFLHLSEQGDNFIIIFESKNNKAIDELMIKNICNDFIDQQIRIETERQFGHIRDLIVEEAFKPVSK